MAIHDGNQLQTGMAEGMKPVGPSRAELVFRLWISVAGLSMLLSALAFRGFPAGPAMFEVVAIAGAFFGGTFLWALRRLRRGDYTEEP